MNASHAPSKVAALLTGMSVRWVNCHPDPRQRVYFANHTSHLDTLMILAALPAEVRALTRPVAASDYWAAGKVRRYMSINVLNAILIEREHVSKRCNPIHAVARAIEDRYSVVLFPEGTRGAGVEVAPFKCGLYHLARTRPKLELVPVYLENLHRVLPKGQFLPVPLLSTITFGPPLQLYLGEYKFSFLQRARQSLLSLRQ